MHSLTLSIPAVHEPRHSVPNSALPFSKERHRETFGRVIGIDSRPVSELSEADMASRAVLSLFQQFNLSRDNCVGLVVASSSMSVERGGILSPEDENNADYAVLQSRWDDVARVVRALEKHLSPTVDDRYVKGINWGCSNFPKALELCCQFAREQNLHGDQFILLVTTNRLSQHMDWSQVPTAIFGDYATASAVSREGVFAESRKILHAKADWRWINAVGFSCRAEESLVGPSLTDTGVHFTEQQRPVGLLSMNGEVINTNAPSLLTDITHETLDKLKLPTSKVPHWVPHQAGKKIIDGFADKARIDHDRIERVYRVKGNLTASSIPQALWERWENLNKGPVVCPSVGTGPVGTKSMTRGIVVLE
ncbi:MAG: 3-oxoacyl-[acyl-carrier-protein] synthase III C-terminal domain-containing protein [Pseudomonadota bacterium]